MVNYHDPVVVVQDYLVLWKLWHALAGLYFWEFVTTLDYEWDVIRGHRPFRWTIWIYFTTRIATLLAVVLSVVVTDVGHVTARYNCEVETVFLMAFSYLATAAASLLIVLRIIAIWNMKKIVIAIATIAWGTGFIFQIQTVVRIRVESNLEGPGNATCVVANPHIINLNTVVSFTTDIILLLIMFFGLFRLRFHKSRAFGMGRLLWRQGLAWLLVALIADILPLVFLCLNLNDPLDDIFLAPWVIASSIAATRIHRDLVDYASAGCTEQQFNAGHSKANGRAELEWKVDRVIIMRTQQSHVKVTIPEMYEQDETPQISQHGSAGSLIDVEGQSYEKPAGKPRLDINEENSVVSATESSTT